MRIEEGAELIASNVYRGTSVKGLWQIIKTDISDSPQFPIIVSLYPTSPTSLKSGQYFVIKSLRSFWAETSKYKGKWVKNLYVEADIDIVNKDYLRDGKDIE